MWVLVVSVGCGLACVSLSAARHGHIRLFDSFVRTRTTFRNSELGKTRDLW